MPPDSDQEVRYALLKAGSRLMQHTFSGHRWRVRQEGDGRLLQEIKASSNPFQTLFITDPEKLLPPEQPKVRQKGFERESTRAGFDDVGFLNDPSAAIRATLVDDNLPHFIDEEFPASSSSLYFECRHRTEPVVKWKRLKDVQLDSSMTTCSVLVHNSSGQELRVQIKPVSHGASVTVAPCVADGRMATFPIRESVELCLCRETVMVYQGILNTDSLKTYCLFASAQGVKLQTLDFSQAQPLIFPDLEVAAIPDIDREVRKDICRLWLSDVIQGSWGDCWLLQALQPFASQHPDALQQMISPATYAEDGLYCVHLRPFGSDLHIIIDDYFPCKVDGTLMSSFPRFGQCYWVTLMEKAFAKLLGAFEGLNGGVSHFSPSTASTMLLGNRSFCINWGDLNLGKGFLDDLWNAIGELLHRKEVVMCTSVSSENEISSSGLVQYHGYSIMKAKEISLGKGFDHKFVMIRNTWGKQEWNGAWSTGAQEWEMNESAVHELENVFVDNGQWWMRLEDFVQHFCVLWYTDDQCDRLEHRFPSRRKNDKDSDTG